MPDKNCFWKHCRVVFHPFPPRRRKVKVFHDNTLSLFCIFLNVHYSRCWRVKLCGKDRDFNLLNGKNFFKTNKIFWKPQSSKNNLKNNLKLDLLPIKNKNKSNKNINDNKRALYLIIYGKQCTWQCQSLWTQAAVKHDRTSLYEKEKLG